ncbi:hypothetical protein C900_04958 [Fulvivirga imtechensis AK7]|uniref:Outer membrane protein n=1 Tax=Fulvivirga imtechensis AK7 TaxID=1237149 RepID=L8JKH9_9BACT|nr:RagB/SusD family nutrient uptake outer membrane protein [Fulvivirga imtechensis]ELR69426.1 hypothetical protein C900_04958 [Fulvivirga imtechensis AK7]
MKKIAKYTLISVITLLMVACSDDFLEERPTQYLTQEQVTEAARLNPEVIAGSMAGIYSLMYQTGTGGTNLDHRDFGQKSWDIQLDMLSGNMSLSVNTYGWYRDLTQLTLMDDYTGNLHYMPWRYYYRIIRSANTVIDGLGGQDIVPELQENQWTMGQARVMRAHSYFYLSQLYTREYNAGKAILPIYTSTSQENQAKSITSDVFDLIVKDLEEGISLLDGYMRPTKTEVDANIAKVILAYALAYRNEGNDMTRAKDLTNEVINSGGYPLTSTVALTGGFNDVNTPSWMWGVDLTSDQDLDLVSWWGQIDIYTYSYAAAGDVKAIDAALYSLISNDDVRKAQFNPDAGTFYLTPYNKFYDPDRKVSGQRNITTDYVYMRIEEAYLLCAEAAARSGDEAMARTRLKEMLENRLPDVSYIDGLSGDALMNEIYKQIRIELWGEGKAYLAMKRNKYNVVRGSNWAFSPNVIIDYNDTRLMFEIPQSEIQNNPLLNDNNH